MKRNTIILIIIVVIIAGAMFIFLPGLLQVPSITPSPTPSWAPTLSPTPSPTSSTPFDQSVSDGTITIHFPSLDFGLATNPQQVLTKAYIPPCGEHFDYCLYYIGNAYTGTNFESAGIRIFKRTDLTTQAQCLTTPPTNYTTMTPTSTAVFADYAVSEFSPLGDAGMGHYASGTLYRLACHNACYEFETRIGQTQFLNYPTGSIKEFTLANQTTLTGMLGSILSGITLPSGNTVSLPQMQ